MGRVWGARTEFLLLLLLLFLLHTIIVNIKTIVTTPASTVVKY